jgi:hypothetical protein
MDFIELFLQKIYCLLQDFALLEIKADSLEPKQTPIREKA